MVLVLRLSRRVSELASGARTANGLHGGAKHSLELPCVVSAMLSMLLAALWHTNEVRLPGRMATKDVLHPTYRKTPVRPDGRKQEPRRYNINAWKRE